MNITDKNKIVFKDIFYYFLVGFTLCFIALLFTCFYSYKTIYNQALQESTAAIRGALATEQRKMANLAESYGYWGQTYDHVIKHQDDEWIKDNITQDISNNFSIPYVAIFVTDKNYTTLYSNNEIFGIKERLAPSSISNLLIDFTASGNKAKSKTHFIKHYEQIYMVTLSRIVDRNEGKTQALIALIKPFTAAYMDQISHDYALTNLDLVIGSDHMDMETLAHLAIKQDDKTIGYMTWSPQDSAGMILKVLIPMGFIVILLLISIGFLITQKIIKANIKYASILGELAQSAEELMQAKEKSDESSKAKTRFLSMMSHEIKTPMSGLMGMITLLKDTELNQAQIEYVNTMETSSTSLLRLVDNILEYSKLESGEVSLMFSNVNLRQMISEIHGLLLPISVQKKLKFEIHIEERVPMVIRADAIRLRQVLLHLLTNALKFTKVGSVRLNVTSVDLMDNRCEISLQIIDTGIGIPDGIKNTLFQDFFQAAGEINPNQETAGLGLTIVKNITHLLGAKIGVESKLGQGSIFWFQMEAEVITHSHSEDISEATPQHLQNLNILLIEEENPNGSFTRNLLEKAGSQVETASNVAVAAGIINTDNFDAILIQIPENGSLHGDFSPQTIKTAMTGKPYIPILGIAKEDDNSFDLTQYDRIVTPPLTSTKLNTLIAEVMEARQPH
ncbi:ATP-binding protein [Candidatus Odyssella thessalonicensis]|uniref:ATP-binding protein n=1 Tax=Candidatus Odyssella thessalonicensis TaxID=84647 RepID=UPI000225B1C5|nr:ATP-binding protein [Candidatus Odyssella thessalonicensis]